MFHKTPPNANALHVILHFLCPTKCSFSLVFNFNFFFPCGGMTYWFLTQSVYHMPGTFLNTLHILPFLIHKTALLLFPFYQQGTLRLRVTKLVYAKAMIQTQAIQIQSPCAWSLPCTASSLRANRFVWVVFVVLTKMVHLDTYSNAISALHLGVLTDSW